MHAHCAAFQRSDVQSPVTNLYSADRWLRMQSICPLCRISADVQPSVTDLNGMDVRAAQAQFLAEHARWLHPCALLASCTTSVLKLRQSSDAALYFWIARTVHTCACAVIARCRLLFQYTRA